MIEQSPVGVSHLLNAVTGDQDAAHISESIFQLQKPERIQDVFGFHHLDFRD